VAARLSPKHDELTRAKIQTSQLVNLLQSYATGGKDPKTHQPVQIDKGRLKAIEILLRKSLPDLSAQTVDATVHGEVKDISAKPITEAEWEKTYGATDSMGSTGGASGSTH